MPRVRCTPTLMSPRIGSLALMSERLRLKAEIVVESRPSSRSNLAPISRLMVFSGFSWELLTDMAKATGLGWDVVFGSDIFRRYKPDPKTYLGAARLLGLEPGQVMLASAHNGDLAHARRHGLLTAFFPRRTEYGAGQTHDLAAEQEWDVAAEDIGDLAAKLGC